MEAKELRIGNLIYYGSNVATSVFPEIIFKWNEYKNICKPIPLTESILICFGFDNQDWSKKLNYEDKLIILSHISNEGEFNFYLEQSSTEYFTLKPMKYVHEFQNIIYDLTGEELTCNEYQSV